MLIRDVRKLIECACMSNIMYTQLSQRADTGGHRHGDQGAQSHLEPLDAEAVATFHPANDIQEVRREDEGHPLPPHAQEGLPVSQDVTEVDVEQVTYETGKCFNQEMIVCYVLWLLLQIK